jgi:hypothetical protein
MDDRIELLHRRITLYRGYLRDGASAPQAALYLTQIQRDETELRALAPRRREMADENIDPAFLRARAQHYRKLAGQTTDARLASIYRELAKAFDAEAEKRDGLNRSATARLTSPAVPPRAQT